MKRSFDELSNMCSVYNIGKEAKYLSRKNAAATPSLRIHATFRKFLQTAVFNLYKQLAIIKFTVEILFVK